MNAGLPRGGGQVATPNNVRVVVRLKANMLVLMVYSFIKYIEATGLGRVLIKCSVNFLTNNLTFDNRFTGSTREFFL